MIAAMRLPSSLSYLIDEATGAAGGDAFLTALGARLVVDGMPLAGGAFTQAAPHPIITRRTWLWRADTGRVIEALGFGFAAPVDAGNANIGRDWLAGLGDVVHEDLVGGAADGTVLGWAATRPLSESVSELLHEAARYAAAPLAAPLMAEPAPFTAVRARASSGMPSPSRSTERNTSVALAAVPQMSPPRSAALPAAA